MMQQAPDRATVRSQKLLAGTAMIADVAAVVALLSAPSTYVAVAAALATLAGAYVLVRGWGRPFRFRMLFGVVGLTAGVATLAVVVVPRILPQSSASAAVQPARSPVDSAPRTAQAGRPTAESSGSVLTVSPNQPPSSTAGGGEPTTTQVKLELDTGVDLDAMAPKVVRTDGPNGSIDLYLAHEYIDEELRANNSVFVTDTGTEQGAYDRCADLIDRTDSVAERRTSWYLRSLSVGRQFCFRTSERRLAMARVNDPSDKYLVLNVTIWRH